MTNPVSKTKPRTGIGIAVLVMGAMFLLGGAASMGMDHAPDGGVAHAGVLLEATASSGHKGLHNNTTLRVRRFNGKLEQLEVRSSVRMSDVPKIRKLANQHSGERVVYYCRDYDFGPLISMRTVSGEVIVSEEHTRAAGRFTSWGMLITGLICGLAGLSTLLGTHKPAQGKT